MRQVIISFGIILGLWSALSAGHVIKNSQRLEHEIARLQHEIFLEENEAAYLKSFSQMPPIPLLVSYRQSLKDFDAISRACRVKGLVNIKTSFQGEISSAIRPSFMKGLHELPIEVVFSGVNSGAALGSLLEGISAMEHVGPYILRRIYHAGDSLVCQLDVIGI
ncbi:MAG: hypothetical protein HQL16_04840 [Candidatus Omnitrophica bacterium]|nr:hypothetical protein [Candidatus Omnitrophota bacterium]